jgi:hypothetical protein
VIDKTDRERGRYSDIGEVPLSKLISDIVDFPDSVSISVECRGVGVACGGLITDGSGELVVKCMEQQRVAARPCKPIMREWWLCIDHYTVMLTVRQGSTLLKSYPVVVRQLSPGPQRGL